MKSQFLYPTLILTSIVGMGFAPLLAIASLPSETLSERDASQTLAISIANSANLSLAVSAQPKTTIAKTTQADLPTLKLGQKGTAVTLLQNTLKLRGFWRDNPTGNFDSRTEAAVKTFQQHYKLPINGVVNAATWQKLLFPPLTFSLPSRGAPGKREEAGSRSIQCPVLAEGKQGLTALVTQKNLGFTGSDRPTFWFYVPYQPKYTIEFTLKDEAEKEIFTQRIDLRGTPGIISINYPMDKPPLKMDKQHLWMLSLICNPEKRSDDRFVKGYVSRKPLTPEFINQLQLAKTPRDKIWVYAANNFWYETLTNLIAERRKNPKDRQLEDDWKKLLKIVELEVIDSQPVVNCCTAEK
jgi:peptidoglycan hydrolase-like protein with peptidoglycan-binding domain